MDMNLAFRGKNDDGDDQRKKKKENENMDDVDSDAGWTDEDELNLERHLSKERDKSYAGNDYSDKEMEKSEQQLDFLIEVLKERQGAEWQEVSDPYSYDYIWARKDEQAMNENWLKIEGLGKLGKPEQYEWESMMHGEEEENKQGSPQRAGNGLELERLTKEEERVQQDSERLGARDEEEKE